MNWEHLFRGIILERGYEYYIQGLVENIEIEAESIHATVNGTEDYEVEIGLNNGKIDYMYCDCPYAEDCNNCKHMAAVLYEYEERLQNPPLNTEISQTSNISEFVAKADERYVREFLTDILNNNDILKQRFLIKAPKAKSYSLTEYKRLVDNTIDNHEDKYGFINYREAYELTDDLLDFSDDIRAMIDSGNYFNAFDLSFYICEQVDMSDIDDDGGISLLFNELTSYWDEIAEKTSPDEKDKLFKKITEYNKQKLNFFDEYIEAFIFRSFRETRFISKLFEWIDYDIQHSDKDSYDFSHAIIRKLDLLKDTDTSFEKIEKVCKEYWFDHNVRQWLAKEYEAKSEYQKAINIYEESLKLDVNYRGLINGYRKKLLRLYQNIGNTDKYMEYLWLLVTQGNKTELYKELKSQYTPDEWINEREKIFPHYTPLGQANLLYEEKLYDRLWEVVKNQHIDSIMGYEDVLLPKYSEEILKTYALQLNQMSVTASGRKEYQYWVQILQHMKKIKGGKALVDQIVADWKNRYKNRRAMMDELKNL